MNDVKYEHIPISFFIILINTYTHEILYKKLYLDLDCMDKFFETLDEIREIVVQLYKKNVRMHKLTAEEKQEYDEAKFCHICEKKLNKDKVRDHDHMTGKYRGPSSLEVQH